ncbi:MAG TPA: bifunctional nuclease family protein [Longimicrobiaceae bacterium]|nr:bifunctional nuclease family protein [Longimicrobiaceae bacterium]
MIQVRVQSLGLDQTSKTPVVILQEVEGSRVLPIWIGPAEASAIAMELAGMKFSRPLTHDLFPALIRGLGGTLTRVLITRVQENTYYAEMVIRRGDEVFTVDARPSDSIAIALRLQAELYTSDDLLSGTAVQFAEAEEGEEGLLGNTPAEEGAQPESSKLTPEQLKEHLKKMNPEDLGRFNP